MRRIAVCLVLLGLPTAASAGGMPQLDFSNPLTTSQVVWLALIFFVLYLLLKRWALPQVAGVLQARAETIRRDLDAAQATKTAADEAGVSATAAAHEARAAAQGEINSALEAAKQQAAAEGATLNARLEADLAAAETRIAAARAEAMGALHAVAAETAATVVARLTGRETPTDRVGSAVAAEIAARGLAGGKS